MPETEPPQITVIGSLNKDLVTRTSRIPGAGETLTSESFTTGSGGKGANQAVACARLGKHDVHSNGTVLVRMIGAVGDDAFGVDLIDALHRDGINTDGVQTLSHMKTGVSVVIVEEDTGENRILFSPGANYFIEPGHLNQVLVPRPPDLIVLQLEIRLNLVLAALKLAKDNGIDVLLNPAPALELPHEVYPAITHLIMNETEAATLSKIPGNDWKHIARKFHDLGVRNVIITLGSEGVFFSTRDQTGHIAAEKVKVVDTTAAGDTFVGAYAVAVVSQTDDENHENIELAVRKANKAAGMTVQKHGAQEGIPYSGDLPP
ncbi:MAG: hypothetical protein HETSPECPRED_002532 [Heterodermia speciosa]|uniref:Ribokinase n=1 Tax=Heterodermia speciosa TaxID=116794 RepID=A0A8H3I5E5_9LECA|nr:MAG: hypothetical protein HETSPECPRED_002532 [Heterodermia speciosa]